MKNLNENAIMQDMNVEEMMNVNGGCNNCMEPTPTTPDIFGIPPTIFKPTILFPLPILIHHC